MRAPIIIIVDSKEPIKMDEKYAEKFLWHVMQIELKQRHAEKVSMDLERMAIEGVENRKNGNFASTSSSMAPSTSLLDSFFEGNNGANNNVVGVLVLCCIVAAALMLLCAGFLMYRLCSRTLDGVRRKMTMDFTKAFPNVVAHPKRVYEIQAEEGVFSSSDLPSEEEQPKAGSLRRDQPSRSSSHSGDSLPSLDSPDFPSENLPNASDSPTKEEVPSNFRKKERKIHKDSVCAMVFKSAHPKRPFPELV